MAELDVQLRLDIDQALRDINQIETALDRALASVDLRLDTTSVQRQFDDLARTADQALSDVDIDFDTGSASRLNSELDQVEQSLTVADIEAGQLEGSLRGAARAAGDVEERTSSLARGFDRIKTGAAGLIAGFGAFAAIRGAIGFATSAKDAFATLQDSANAVKVVFGDAVGVIEEFGETVAQSAGLSTAEFNQSASILGSSLLNVGFSADEAARRTVDLTQRAADMASIFGGPVSDALGAIQSALRGETDPIERFGVSLSEAAVNAQAASLGFQTVAGEFSTSEKAAARLDLIMQQTARTSGDFANTSDDLANAQKVLAAEFENAKASLGEALLPIFQTLLDIAPEAITAIEQMAPSIQAFAVSLGNLIEHREGALDLLDVLEQLADIPRAFGALGTIFTAIGDAEGASQRFTEQINTQGLIQDLREGADAASALANRLAQVARDGKLNPAFIRDLTRIAGTDVEETAAALGDLARRGKELGLTDDEIRNVAVALAQLNSVGESSEVDRWLARTAIAAGDAVIAVSPAAAALALLRGAADEAGVELSEFALSADPAAQALFDALDPADQLTVKLDGIRSGAITLADAFTTSLAPSIIDAADALIDFSDNGNVSVAEFIRGLNEGVAASLAFKANLQTLFEIDPRAAAIVAVLPIEAAMQKARELVEDPLQIPLVIAASEDLQGVAALQQAAILQVIEMVREGIPEQTIADFVTLSTDPETGFGPQFEDSLVAAWDFATGGAQDRLIAPDFTPIYIAAIEGIDTGAIQTATDQIFADLNPPTYPKPKVPEPPTAEEKSRVGDQILELFERDDALNQAAGFTAETYNDQLIVAMGTRAFATQQDLDAFITNNFTQEDAATTAADATSGAYSDGLADVDLGDLDLADQIAAIFGADDVLNAALLAGLATSDAFWEGATSKGVTPKVTTAVTEIISDAIGWKSPPKLFLDAGTASGDAFWSGFEQSNLQLKVPTPAFSGSIATSSGQTAAGTGGGGDVIFNLAALDTRDADTTIARAGQIGGQVVGILNSRFHL